MNRATPQLREFARRLNEHEARQKESIRSHDPAVFAVLDRLRPPLSTLMGNGGHRALILRALTLAGAEFPWMHGARVAPDGALNASLVIQGEVEPMELSRGGVALVAQLIGLLVAFIGEKLTLQLLLDIWPKLPRRDWDFIKRDST